MKKKILFGAGLYGRIAMERYGKENIAFFVDNNERLWGQQIDGKEVRAPESLLTETDLYDIVITTKYKNEIAAQLNSMRVGNFTVFVSEDFRYYPSDDLIVNPYLNANGKYLDSSPLAISQKIRDIDVEVDRLREGNQLFDHVEIETINRCNGYCRFCPVSVGNDSREHRVMSWELFQSIIDQLSEISYSGRLALFSNNEPFLDESIIEKHEYARKKLPNAKIHLFTNGTLLTIDKFTRIIPLLDELVIDNYQQELKLLKPCKEIAEYCEAHPELKKKVTIILRKPDEILSSRGGEAPNRTDRTSYPEAKCVLPYKQLIIRPDGRVSLCCNDALGKVTLADLNRERLLEAWNNEQFRKIRDCLYIGREKVGPCKYCDAFNIG